MRPPPQILVVDDEPGVLAFVQQYLAEEGYEVRVARDAREAMRLTTPRTSLVLTDVVMPEVDGIEYVRRLRRTRPGVPVIVMTGHASARTLQDARGLGVRHYLLKPFDLEDLGKRIREALAETDRWWHVRFEAETVRALAGIEASPTASPGLVAMLGGESALVQAREQVAHRLARLWEDLQASEPTRVLVGRLHADDRSRLREALDSLAAWGDVAAWLALAGEPGLADLAGYDLRLHAGTVALVSAVIAWRRTQQGVAGVDVPRVAAAAALAGLLADVGVVRLCREAGDAAALEARWAEHVSLGLELTEDGPLPGVVQEVIRGHHAPLVVCEPLTEVVKASDVFGLFARPGGLWLEGSVARRVGPKRPSSPGEGPRRALEAVAALALRGGILDPDTVGLIGSAFGKEDLVGSRYVREIEDARRRCPLVLFSPSEDRPATALCGADDEQYLLISQDVTRCERRSQETSHAFRSRHHAQCIGIHRMLVDINHRHARERG